MKGDTPTCKAMIGAGEDCDQTQSTDQCGLGSLCVQAGAAEKATCAAYGTIENGNELKGWTFGAVGQNNLICKSGHILQAGTEEAPTYWCMGATKNDGDITKGVASGAECTTTTFVDTTDATKTTPGKTTAKCGFNEGTMAFCPLQTGDQQVQDAASAFVTSWTAQRTACPDGGNPTLCTKWSADDKTNVVNFLMQSNMVTFEQGWPNVADNAACIKDTYTRWFHGGNAATVGFAAVFAALSIVF
jgi:hypothetical protein